MKPLVVLASLVLAACAADRSPDASHERVALKFEPWSDAAFARAKSEHKLVLLDLQAVWCHWCHVMEETTYADPAVAQILSENFVTIQVDQDSRPDISIRYEDYGWPATILFDSTGREIVKRAGYIPPRDMESLLRATIADPTPGPSIVPAKAIAFASASTLSKPLEGELNARVVGRYDQVLGGYGSVHKYVDPDSVEWLLARARLGDARAAAMARQTLDAGLQLIDPVWGGVYQYSAGGVWTEPHFEKIMSFQADDLRVYALAARMFDEPKYTAAARAIRAYLRAFLTSSEGAFYTSQDADLVQGEHSAEYFALDDAARRARGIPRIDTHVYARENGWAIRGLCAFAAYTGDESAIADARHAADWILAHRALADGGFAHGDADVAGPFLGDTLSMGQAFLALYETTGERNWLSRASAAARFAAKTFAHANDGAGFRTTAPSKGALDAAVYSRAENIAFARFANALVHYAGTEFTAMRDEALRCLATREIALDGLPGGVLLAASESRVDPLHVTIVGRKDDAAAKALFDAARALPESHKRVEWYDASEGPLANDDVPFPDSLPRAAAFACTNGRCLSPAYEPAAIAERVASARKAP